MHVLLRVNIPDVNYRNSAQKGITREHSVWFSPLKMKKKGKQKLSFCDECINKIIKIMSCRMSVIVKRYNTCTYTNFLLNSTPLSPNKT